MIREAYGHFAWVYDGALGRPFARATRPTLEKIIVRYLDERRGPALDLACGTGLSTQFLSGLGFEPFGIDASLPMLTLARHRSLRVAAADVRALPLRRRFSLVTCLYDSLNHMLELDDLEDSMREASLVLSDDGLFLFDVNQPEVYAALWDSEEPFRHDDQSRSLTMYTSYDSATGMATAMIEGRAEGAQGPFRFEETRRQRAWRFDEIAGAVARAGLRIDSRVDFDPFGQSRDSGLGIKWLIAVCH